MKVMVIDDSNTTRFILIKMLREMGHSEIIAAASAEEAIPLIPGSNIDLMLLDWNLPKMSGIDLLRHIKGDPATQKIPVVMVTTLNNRNSIVMALKTGVQGFILKPVNREILESKLNEIQQLYAKKV